MTEETPNSGSIVYEVSRDNGVTWTPIERNILTDVSSQPNGTQIVIRATITDNALINAWAVSWS